MLNMKKFGIISSAIIGLYSAPMVIANNTAEDLADSFLNVSRGTMNAWGEIENPADKDPSLKANLIAQDQAVAQQDAYDKSWNKFGKDAVIATAKYTGATMYDMASYAARTALAWNVNYYAINTVEEGIAYTAYGLATLAGGPAAGSGGYYAAKGALKVARYTIPGFEGYISGVLAPVTRAVVVDPVINYGPAVVKGVANVGMTGAQYVASGLSSLYSYWNS